MTRPISLVLLTLLLLCALAAPGLSRNPQSGPPADEHDFGDKVVMVSTGPTQNPKDNVGGYLEKAKVRRLGDRFFVVGKAPMTGIRASLAEPTIWIPLEDVETLVEYDSVEHAQKDFEAHEKDQEANPLVDPAPVFPVQEPEIVPTQPPAPSGN